MPPLRIHFARRTSPDTIHSLMEPPYLEIQDSAGRRHLPVRDDPITIGRHPQNQLVIVDEQASRYHCVVEHSTQGYAVRDLESRNGTKVHGQPIQSAVLLGGDVIVIGRATIKLVLPVDEFDVVDEEVPLDDMIEEEDQTFAPEPLYIDPDASEHEQTLMRMLSSLPDRTFEEEDITLLNARGGASHSDRDQRRAKKHKAEREPIDIFRMILLVCFRIKASDIHIEPKREDTSVRIRVDGNMVDLVRFDKDTGVRLLSAVKILCDIDIAQRNIVQEGHFAVQLPDRRVDYRISFAPALNGQKLVIRILDAANAPHYVWDLQLPKWMLDDLQKAIQQEAGMVLACGPTGSGKTTTLYALVRSIDSGERNVVTIEDPVEIQLEGITQLPVNEATGNSFGALLKSVLRQDPDAILVGEIRDPETARIALQSAITGHLVFSTIHSRSTIDTIFRLLDLGLEPYLVASGLQRVLAQRLVRQLCPSCKVPLKPTPEQIAAMGPAGEGVKRLFGPKGCQRCLHTGFAGRRVIFELLTMTDAVRDAILRNPTLMEIQKALADTKFQKLSSTGYELVASGVTSFEEVERAVG